MKVLLFLGMILVAGAQVFAQCSWCKTATDVCCDSDFSGITYELPCNTSSIYIQYDGAANNRVEFIIADVSGGQYSELVHGNQNDFEHCDCAKYFVYSSPINAGHVLQFKVKCRECSDDCDHGNLSVTFFTPSSNTCAANCSGS